MKRIPGNVFNSAQFVCFIFIIFSRCRKSINGKARFVTGNAYCLLSNNIFSYGKEENKEIKLI